jgi:hypothetical protein
MKTLFELIGFLISFFILVIFCAFVFGGLDIETKYDKSKFKEKDIVYVLPDSTEAVISDCFFVTSKDTVLVTELYDLMYTDKVGVIHKIKWINPEILVKK